MWLWWRVRARGRNKSRMSWYLFESFIKCQNAWSRTTVGSSISLTVGNVQKNRTIPIINNRCVWSDLIEHFSSKLSFLWCFWYIFHWINILEIPRGEKNDLMNDFSYIKNLKILLTYCTVNIQVRQSEIFKIKTIWLWKEKKVMWPDLCCLSVWSQRLY